MANPQNCEFAVDAVISQCFPYRPHADPQAGSHVYEISVVSYQGAAPADRMAAVFGADGGTIGRGNSNTLVLPDPNRFVSRLQAKVELIHDRLAITNASSANPLLVNDREIDAGAGVIVADGDELRIGLYLLRVRRVAVADENEPMEKTQLSVTMRSSYATAPRAFSDGAAHGAPPQPLPSPPIPDSSSTDSSLGPLDPLQLPIDATKPDPFADLVPEAHPPGAQPAAPTAQSPSRSRSAPSPHTGAAVVPEDVWEGLARLAPDGSAPINVQSAAISPDFDAFAGESEAKRNAEDPLAEFVQSGVALESFDKLDTSIDALFNDAGPANSSLDVIPDPNATANDPLAAPTSVDPLAVFAKTSRPLEPALGRSEPDHAPELHGLFRPAEPRFAPGEQGLPRSRPVSAPPQDPFATPSGSSTASRPQSYPNEATKQVHVPSPDVVASPDATSRSPDPVRPPPREQALPQSDILRQNGPAQPAPGVLLDAFLAGAGIPNAIVKDGMTPEMMKAIGTLLAAAVQGTIELIATRAMLKREVKAEVTLIATTKNNPLKFLPDAESALLQMFGARIPGFMSPLEAMQDAFQDLRAHEVGVIAGMRAALADVLRRFEPAELEKRLKRPGILESLVPNSRQARLWQSFTEMYGDISREAQDDFQTLFGKAFLAAYEAEVERLKRS